MQKEEVWSASWRVMRKGVGKVRSADVVHVRTYTRTPRARHTILCLHLGRARPAALAAPLCLCQALTHLPDWFRRV